MSEEREIEEAYDNVEGLDEMSRTDVFLWILRRVGDVSATRDTMELEQQTGGEPYDLTLAREHFDELRALAVLVKTLQESDYGL